MKKFISVLVLTMFVASVISPGVSFAQSNQSQEKVFEAEGFTLIKDTESEIIYQIEEDGEIYEYVETVEINGNEEIVSVKKYLVNNDKKESLVEENSSKIEQTGEKLTVTDLESGESVTIDTSEKKLSTKGPQKGYTDKGGSYVADCRYTIWKDNVRHYGTAIMNGGDSRYSKDTYRTNSHFIRFQGHADNLRSKEKEIATLGFLTTVEDLAKALMSGKVLSWKLVKILLKGASKGSPVGIAWNIYSYGKEWNSARYDFRKITHVNFYK
ncbi:hypothetical protein LC087_19180 (plasmid) [Bacillus carboniphilus]|uniref:Uncharacterized protein n=1 Tax=Bacillus carboniphilus TaxID=86663 RepID=A0ABY9K0X4_9BACI|nr:hypothetical protein [Bacillus carboniphilus]WLR44492.1 hypothetical protein LC087_19180 [Bacillus carboniphilus]